MTEKKERWLILDDMLSRGVPVSTDDIYREWANRKIRSKNGNDDLSLTERYALTLRQDLYAFEDIYRKAGLNGPLFEKVIDGKDRRKCLYRYANSNFSMKPFIKEDFTRSDWASLDRAMDKLQSEISEDLADKVNFLVRSRLESLRGGECFIDWSDKPYVTGYDLLPELYGYVSSHTSLTLAFGLFGEEPLTFVLHPYILKEYIGRWFCLGFREDKQVLWPVALDRVVPGSIKPAGVPFREYDGKKVDGRIAYFDDVIGVTTEYNEVTARDYLVSDTVNEIVLGIHSRTAWDYIRTNPVHHSQKVLSEFDDKSNYGSFSLHLRANIEMYNALLALGPGVTVDSPLSVREVMKFRLAQMMERY